ncbi:hypothetical protein F4861DRAFT_512018 [Xylaria intraflava]|nr:hypothetical protein F4861DRAFT_512018 [Xylaria intraflava]
MHKSRLHASQGSKKGNIGCLNMAADSESEYRESSSEHEAARSPTHNPPSASPTRRSAPLHTRRKRRRGEPVGPPPKRVKSGFNAAYLNLLNQDIQDASAGLIHDRENPELEHTQIGEVIWSAAEKNIFFAAVGRLGKDNVAGISARIGTKSEPEVRQYLILLDLTKQRRSHEERRAQCLLPPADIPAAVEIGAECVAALEATAGELALRQEVHEEHVEKARWGSQWLITASLAQILEDSFPDQQEEDSRPTLQPRKGKRRLKDEKEQNENPRLTKANQEERDGFLEELPFLQLFHVQNWLQLSDRVFMNSAMSDGNWHALSTTGEPPAIRATAFADFYGLALSITRRLVLAAMYMTESRIRTKSLDATRRRSEPRVRVEDVAAAVSSLGMENSRTAFWARCARRFQLNIVDDSSGGGDFTDQEDEGANTEGDRDTDTENHAAAIMSPPGHEIDDPESDAGENETDNYEIMDYDEVEAALDYPVVDDVHGRPGTPDSHMSSTTESISSTPESELDEEDQEELGSERDEEGFKRENRQEATQDTPENVEMTDQTPNHGPDEGGLDQAAIAQDIEEAMVYSLYLAPMQYSTTEAAPTRHAIESRILAEHRRERDAELLDLKTSADAEADLWAILCGNSTSRTKDDKGRHKVAKGEKHGGLQHGRAV